MAVKTRADLKAENALDFQDNVAQLISPADLRGQMDDIADSMFLFEDLDTPGGPASFGDSGGGASVSDEPYSAITWDGATAVAPSKNAVRDKIESLIIGGSSSDLKWVNVADYGLIADGGAHALSTRYASLAAAQAVYPFATSLAQEIDYCACKAASNAAFGADLQFETGAYTAVSSASDAGHVVDATKTWTVDEHRHKTVYRKKLSGAVDSAQIMNNDATTLTLGTGSTAANLPNGVVDATDTYAIVFAVTGTATDASHITDLTQSWVTNEHVGKVAFRRFVSSGGGSYGPGPSADAAPILSNDATTLTLASALPSVVSATQLYAIGQGENSATNQHLNKPLWLPPGRYRFGNDTWLIRDLVGARIEGAGERAVALTGNKTVLKFDGLWYTELSNFSIECVVANVDESAGLDIDGNVPGHPYATRGVQAVTLRNMLISGGGSKYAFTLCRLGGGNAQGSECLYSKVHLQAASFACYYQNGFNALANTFMGGNFQSYGKYGAYIIGGTFAFINTGFQSTQGYRQIENAGADIRCGDSGAYEGCIIYGCRTESPVFLYNAGAVRVDVRACVGRVAMPPWSASTSFGAAANSYKAIVDASPGTVTAVNRLFVATTEGTTGTVEPVWGDVPTGGTVADGTIVWTETPFNSITNNSGSVDIKTVQMLVGNQIHSPRYYFNRSLVASASLISATIQPYEDALFVDATSTTGGTFTVNAPALPQLGREFLVKKTDLSANTLTINLTQGFEHLSVPVIIPGGSRGFKRFMYVQGVGSSNTWVELGPKAPIGKQTISTNANLSIVSEASPYHTLHIGTLTADRNVILTPNVIYSGQTYRITRTGGGAFNLNVGPTASATAWATGTALLQGATRLNGGNTYAAAVGGTTAPVSPANDWLGTHAYIVGNLVINDSGKWYKCLTAGTSAASGGPTGTATSSIADGSVVWGNVPTTGTTGPSGTVIGAPVADGTVTWLYQPVPVKALATGQWCEVTCDSAAAWYLSAFGSL